MMDFTYPVGWYRIHLTQDAVGGQIQNLVQHAAVVWTFREDLSGRELLDARRLEYEHPRKYTFIAGHNIEVGDVFLDEGIYYVIKSLERQNRILTVATAVFEGQIQNAEIS